MRAALNQQEISAIQEWGPPVFQGGSAEDVEHWLSDIETGCRQRSIPEHLIPSVACIYLDEGPKESLNKCEDSYFPDFMWNWEMFKMAMIKMAKGVPPVTEGKEESQGLSLLDNTNRLIREHPTATKAAGAILVGAGACVLVPAAGIGALGLIGFGPGGVVGGSAAAAIQSAVYGGSVASGSLFAMAQSAGATAVAASIGVQAVAAVSTAVGAWIWGAPTPPGSEST